ncbi:MAG: AMP-binding protein [Thiolinea sp.]
MQKGERGGFNSPPVDILDFHQSLTTQPDDHLISGRNIKPDDIAAYFHTGGTTGAPKLAIHTHGNQVFTAWASVQLQSINQDDSTINGYPLFHVAGVLPGSLASLSAGVEIIIPTTKLMRNRDIIHNYWKLVEYHKITVVSAVPTALGALANVPLDGADISSVRFCRTGAAPVPAELVERYQELFNLNIQESLGMTEMAGISSITPPGVPSPVGCVGFPLPFSRYKVVALNAEGKPGEHELPQGETGLILVKSPNVFPGYVDSQATQKAFTADGWLNTGDLGFIDAEGRINLNGRAKDLIIRSGHNIDPKMIEEVLAKHEGVELCAAVGAPDDYAGEVPVAFVTLNQRGREAGITESELLDFAATHVNEIPAKPKSVTVLEVMPLTNVGKIFKPELRRLAAAKTGAAQ